MENGSSSIKVTKALIRYVVTEARRRPDKSGIEIYEDIVNSKAFNKKKRWLNPDATTTFYSGLTVGPETAYSVGFIAGRGRREKKTRFGIRLQARPLLALPLHFSLETLGMGIPKLQVVNGNFDQYNYWHYTIKNNDFVDWSAQFNLYDYLENLGGIVCPEEYKCHFAQGLLTAARYVRRNASPIHKDAAKYKIKFNTEDMAEYAETFLNGFKLEIVSRTYDIIDLERAPLLVQHIFHDRVYPIPRNPEFVRNIEESKRYLLDHKE